jgi:hypothetical protein
MNHQQSLPESTWEATQRLAVANHRLTPNLDFAKQQGVEVT